MRRNSIFVLSTLVLGYLLVISSISLAADNWTRKANMAITRAGNAACVLNGKIYVIGGWSGNPIVATVEVYDPVKDTWTKKADMPTARYSLSVNVVNGKIYAIGGSDDTKALAVVEEYNPTTDEWTRKTDMPTARWALSTNVVKGKIYAIGGCSVVGASPSLSTVEEYDPIADKWTKKADIPTARMGLSTSVVNNKIYAFGGQSAAVWIWWNALSAAEVYDPATDTWTKKTDMPTPRTILSSGAPMINGKIFVIGGAANFNTAYSTVEVYDSATDTWAKKTDMPTARMYFSTSEVNGKIYAIGGWSGNVDLAAVEEYTPEGWPFSVSPQNKLVATWGNIKGK